MELRVFVLAARRSLVLLACTLLAGAGVGLVAWRMASPVHQASTVLVMDSGSVTSPGQEPFTGDPDRYISREMEVIGSDAVLSRAAETVRPAATTAGVAAAVSLSHVTGSDVVRVTARADSAPRAGALADAVATAYLGLRDESAQAALEDQRSQLQAQADALADRLSTEDLAPAVSNRLYAMFDQLTTAITALDRPGVLHDDTRVLTTGSAPASSRGLGLVSSVGGGALVGALAGLAVALVRALRRPRVTGQEEVEELTRRPVSAVFPHVRRLDRLALQDGHARLREPAGRLAALVEPEECSPRPWSLTVTSATVPAGCTTVASALALELARQGSRVTLVLAGAPAPWGGLVTAAAPASAPRPSSRENRTAVADRSWLSAEGPVPSLTVLSLSDAGQLTAEDHAKALTEASAGTDVVVVDASSILDSSFARAAVRGGDRVVLVVPELDQPESELRLALEVLDGLHDAPVHVALTCL